MCFEHSQTELPVADPMECLAIVRGIETSQKYETYHSPDEQARAMRGHAFLNSQRSPAPTDPTGIPVAGSGEMVLTFC
jgi:hypothetical protein